MQLWSHPAFAFGAKPRICNQLVISSLEARSYALDTSGERMRKRLRLSVRFRLTGLHLGH